MKILSCDRLEFPDARSARLDPNGLLAVGGDLSPARLVLAYLSGVFPWYGKADPPLWWSPDPRAIITAQSLRISRSMRKLLNQARFTITWNQAFRQIVQACAAPRVSANDTWIVAEMQHAYQQLHELNIAHSIEVWQNQQLVGGLYGISLGSFFFGESMFSLQANASKVALIRLIQQLTPFGLAFLDAQMMTPHLTSLGALAISRNQFLDQLDQEFAPTRKIILQHPQINPDALANLPIARHCVANRFLAERAPQS